MTDKEQGDILRAIGRLEGKFDTHAEAIIASVSRQRVDIEDQEERLRFLEKWRTGVHFVAAFIVTVPSILGAVWAWLKHSGQ